MTLFSNNPELEKIMSQKPAKRKGPEKLSSLPSDSPCYGCPYGKGRHCVGICYKKLLEKIKEQ